MTFYDIIGKELKTENITLTEEELMESFGFSVSPIVAFFAFKKKALDYLSKTPIAAPFIAAKKVAKSGAAKALIAKEKISAEVESKGKHKNDTVYHYTKEQKDFLSKIYIKYGDSIIKEIEKFRKNILAPYQVIKRLVKENRSLSNKEVNGMSYDEYVKYRESGRKKIEAKTDVYTKHEGKSTEVDLARIGYKAAVDSLNDFKNGKDPSSANTEKVLKLLGYGEGELGGYSATDFKKTDEIILKYQGYLKHTKSAIITDYKFNKLGTATDVIEKINNLRKRGVARRNEKIDKIRSDKRVSFERAYLNWQLRKEFREKLKTQAGRNEYKRYYKQVLEDAVRQAEIKKNELTGELVGIIKSVELNSFEKKIWGKKLTREREKEGVKKSEFDNWYLKLKDEDFQGKEKSFEIPESVRKAEDTVNRETKKFERKLKEIMEESEVKELKRLRLINNLITVREMKDPDSLFKKPSEETENFKRIEDEPEEKDEEITNDEFEEKLGDIINIKYDSIEELNKAKNSLKKLVRHTDEKITKKFKSKIDSFLEKTDIRVKPNEKIVQTGLVSINDVQNKINELLTKKFESADEIRNEKVKLNNLINRYKQQDPVNSDRELAETQLLMDSLNRKLLEAGLRLENGSK